jgi:hypothetical protein
MKKQKLYSYTVVTDRTPVYKLSIPDQLRLLFRKLFDDGGELLKAEDAKTAETLKLQADLTEFFYRAARPLREGRENSVTMEISGRFGCVLDETLNSVKIAKYYNGTVKRPRSEFGSPNKFFVTLEVKNETNNPGAAGGDSPHGAPAHGGG